MTAPGEALEALEALEVLEARRDNARRSLARSLALEGLWPGVFAIRGGHKVRGQWRRSGQCLIFVIRASNSLEREWPRPEVPEALRNETAEAETLEWIRRYKPSLAARFLNSEI